MANGSAQIINENPLLCGNSVKLLQRYKRRSRQWPRWRMLLVVTSGIMWHDIGKAASYSIRSPHPRHSYGH